VQAIRLSATTAVIAVLALVAGPCAPARAQQQQQQQLCTPEQTVAALDQYCESVPEAGGPVSSQIGGRPASSTPLGSVLPSRDIARLRNAGGAAGRALLLLPVVAPVGSSPAARAQRRLSLRAARRVVGRRKLPGEQVDPLTVATGLAEAGNDVVGGAFRWGLVVCTAGFAGIGWLRIRTRFRV
jgi:hypothetical protein